MSVNHPLLKELKGHVLELRTSCDPEEQIDDTHPKLLPLCVNIEAIYRLGLRTLPSIVGVMKIDYWSWVDALANCRAKRLSFNATKTIEIARDNVSVKSVQGKGRLFVRAALQRGTIFEITENLVRDYSQLSKIYYNEDKSCMGNEILAEIFLSVLFELNEVNFNLNLANCSFLDTTWLMPIFRTYEFVPCAKLGVRIGYANGHVIALEVEEGGVANEDDKIEVGDVLVDVNGEHLSRCSRSKLSSIFQQCRTQPLQVTVTKCLMANDTVYLPLKPIIERLGLQHRIKVKNKTPVRRANQLDKTETEPFSSPFWSQAVLGPSECSKKAVRFHGRSFVGSIGTMSVIDEGIRKVVDLNNKPVNVWLEIADTVVVMTDMATNREIQRHNYTQIGSCGRLVDLPQYCCYVAGETICNMAKEFYCYVFETSCLDEGKIILQNIALGFDRTNWAV